jgi:uncharacterized membrane protein
MSSPHDADDIASANEGEGEGEGDPAVMRRASWTQGKRLDVGLRQPGYTSPLPTPDDLDRYAAHLPDAPERLLAAGEREQAHRHELENRLAAMDERALPRFFAGERFAHAVSLILGLAYLGAMVLAILQGYPLAGVGGATFGVAAVIWAVRRDPSDAVEMADGESVAASGPET